MKVTTQWYGVTDYKKSLEIMEKAACIAEQTGQALILGFEYEPTTEENVLFSCAKFFEQTNIPVQPAQMSNELIALKTGLVKEFTIYLANVSNSTQTTGVAIYTQNQTRFEPTPEQLAGTFSTFI
jgi:hypothetical protein